MRAFSNQMFHYVTYMYWWFKTSTQTPLVNNSGALSNTYMEFDTKCMHICVSTYLHIHTKIYIYTHIYVYVYTYTYPHIYVCTYATRYIYICTHFYIYIHIYLCGDMFYIPKCIYEHTHIYNIPLTHVPKPA